MLFQTEYFFSYARQVEADRIADSEDESAERIECVVEFCFCHLDGHHNKSFCDFPLTHSYLHVQTQVSRRVLQSFSPCLLAVISWFQSWAALPSCTCGEARAARHPLPRPEAAEGCLFLFFMLAFPHCRRRSSSRHCYKNEGGNLWTQGKNLNEAKWDHQPLWEDWYNMRKLDLHNA